MTIKTVSMPEDVVINLLRTLPEEDLVDIFWKSLVKSDISPHTEEEEMISGRLRRSLKKGKHFHGKI